MKNRMKQLKKTVKSVTSKEEQRQSLIRDLARADDEGFANAKEAQRYSFKEWRRKHGI